MENKFRIFCFNLVCKLKTSALLVNLTEYFVVTPNVYITVMPYLNNLKIEEYYSLKPTYRQHNEKLQTTHFLTTALYTVICFKTSCIYYILQSFVFEIQ